MTDENGVEKVYNFVDILSKVNLALSQDDVLALTDPYEMNEGETPEIVSMKVYDRQDYYWTILFINDFYDYIGDWFMSDDELIANATAKYGEAHIDDEKYAIDEYGIVRRNPDPALAVFQDAFTNVKYTGPLSVVTNFHWDSINNEAKRNIRVIKPSRIVEFVRVFNQKMVKE